MKNGYSRGEASLLLQDFYFGCVKFELQNNNRYSCDDAINESGAQ